MAAYDPLDNPSEVSGLSGEYFIKTTQQHKAKLLAEEKKRIEELEKRKQVETKRKAEEELKTKQRKNLTVNPVKEILTPIAKTASVPFEWIADRAEEAQTAILGAEEVQKRKKITEEVQAGTRSPFDKRDQIPEAERASFKKSQDQLRKDMDAPLDLIRTPVKAILAAPEGVLNIATQAAMDVTVNRGKPDDEYVRAAWSFGAKPGTEAGKIASQLLSFVALTRTASIKLGSLGKLGTSPIPKDVKGAKWFAAKGKRLLTEGAIPGAIADFILTDTEEGNLSYKIQQLVPEEYRNHVGFALAAGPNDKPFVNRLKSTAQGGPLGVLGNAVASLIPARQFAQLILKRGGSKEEALARGVDLLTTETDKLSKNDAVSSEAERIRWGDANEAELNQLLSKEADLNERISRIDAEVDADEAVRLDAELEDIQIRKAELESNFYQSADPDVNKEYWESQATINTVKDPNEFIVDSLKAQDLDGGTNAVGRYAGGNSVFTDAQVRIRNLDDSQRYVYDQFQSKIDYAKIAREAGRSEAEVIGAQNKILDSIHDTLRTFDEAISENDIFDLLKEAQGTVEDSLRGNFPNTEGAGAIAFVLDEFAKDIFDIAYASEKLDYAGIGGANNFDRLIDRFVGLMKMYKESSTYYGSSLNSFKTRLAAITKLQSPGQYVESLKEIDTNTVTGMLQWAEKIKGLARKGDPSSADEMRKLVRAMILAGGDPGKTVKFFSAVGKVAQNSADNIFYNNVLSGVRSLTTNFLAISRAVYDPGAIALRGFFKGDEAIFESGMAGLGAFKGSLGEAWKMAQMSWRSETRSMGSAADVLSTAELKAKIEMMERMATTDTEQMAVGVTKGLVAFAKLVSPVGNFFSSTDTFVQTVIFRQRIAEMATLKAFREAPDVSSRNDLFATYLKSYSDYMDPQTGQIKDKGLALYAQMATFQNDPGKTISAFSTFIRGVPYGKQLIPFVRTPGNIMKYRMEFLPLANKFNDNYAKAVAEGDELMVAEIEGRQIIGNMLWSAGMFLGLSGGATGNMPADPKERKRWQDFGIQQRSFNVAGQQISYARLEPLSDILAMAIDLAAVAKYWGQEQPGAQELVERFTIAGITALAASFTEKAYFANFDAVADLIDIQNLTPAAAEKLIAGYAFSQSVPYASQVRGFANTFDPYKREYNNAWQRVFVGNTPLLRNTLPAMVDELTGKPMRNAYGNAWNANLPFEINPQEKDPIKQMLLKARYNRREFKATEGVKLNAEQREAFRTEVYKTGRIRQRLEAVMKQEWFWKDMKSYRGRPFDPDGDPSQRPRFYNAISDAYQAADQIALAKLKEDDKAFSEQLRQERMKRQKFKRGEYGDTSSSTAEKVNNLSQYYLS